MEAEKKRCYCCAKGTLCAFFFSVIFHTTICSCLPTSPFAASVCDWLTDWTVRARYVSITPNWRLRDSGASCNMIVMAELIRPVLNDCFYNCNPFYVCTVHTVYFKQFITIKNLKNGFWKIQFNILHQLSQNSHRSSSIPLSLWRIGGLDAFVKGVDGRNPFCVSLQNYHGWTMKHPVSDARGKANPKKPLGHG